MEFKAFYGTDKELVDLEDPGHTIYKLSQTGEFEADLLEAARIDTRKFFAEAQEGLILMTPMKTYPKHSYYSGMNLDLVKGFFYIMEQF